MPPRESPEGVLCTIQAKFFSTLLLISLCLGSSAQVQWYQNQDANNAPPNATVGTSVQQLTSSSFVACYQWTINYDQFTWKISKSNIAGQEQASFLITGTTAWVEMKTGKHNNAVYVFERDFPLGQNAQYTIYKLDTNLNVTAQRNIEFPNSFNIFNMNAFELDNSNNLYFAGDGQYPVGPGFSPASFVIKTDRNLVTKWSKMDSIQAAYTRLHIDRRGYVLVINDFYSFFPDIRLKIISPNGQQSLSTTISTDPGRYSLFSSLDDDENLLLYGDKSITDSTQGIYLYKISRRTGRAIYRRTLFTSPGTQFIDLKLDKYGNLFSLVHQNMNSDRRLCKVSRINPYNGAVYWNRSFRFAEDSCNLFKLVLNESDRFYVVGERKSNTYFSKGFMIRMKKNGQGDSRFISPDSVCFQRSHWLSDGMSDRNNQLIAIGGTEDLDTTTFLSTYIRAFAVRFANNNCNENGRPSETTTEETGTEEETTMDTKWVVYPNPVQNELAIANLKPDEYEKLAVYNMQGTLVLQQTIKGTTTRVDVSTLTDGVYLLVLRSSGSKHEKSTKFMVRR